MIDGPLALKLLGSVLAGAVLVLIVESWKLVPAPSGAQHSTAPPIAQESVVARSAPGQGSTGMQGELDRGIPSNYPRRVQTVRFAPGQPGASAGINPPTGNPLAGKRLRYLIGTTQAGRGSEDEITEVSYDAKHPVARGISIAYCNLFDEKNSGRFGPYLKKSDTAERYNEGQIDPRGAGWEKNLREQFERRKSQGFEYIELDNPDAYSVKDVLGAIELAASYGLKVIAKNPGLMGRGAGSYVSHPNVYGIIVEKDGGSPGDMDALRRKAGKPDLPIWFVAFGSGRSWAGNVAGAARRYRNMSVTYSSEGEYGNAVDVVPPA